MNEYTCKICNLVINARKFKYHIEQHNISQQSYYDKYIGIGICPVCKKQTKFHDIIKGYNKYCSRACLNKSSIHSKSVKDTKLIKYGNPTYNNPNKISQSLLNRTSDEKQNSILKKKSTCQEKYGNETYNNSKKYKETCLKIYGTTSPFASDLVKHKIAKKISV